MNPTNRFKIVSLFLIAAYSLAACAGAIPAGTRAKGPKGVSFTGIVQAINGTQWTVGGQTFKLDPQVSLDPNIKIGDQVKVDANVSTDGAVVALKVQSSKSEDNSSASFVDASTPEPFSTTAPDVSTSPQENEVFGTVEAMTVDTVTVNGVTYNLTNASEIKEPLNVGDQVKVHVMVNADGTFTVREIEKSTPSVEDHSKSGASSHEGPNHDATDDHSNHSSHDGANHDSNDDHSGSGSNSGSGDG